MLPLPYPPPLPTRSFTTSSPPLLDPPLQDTLLYRHTNEAESLTADSIVWDWSASRGGQSSYPNTKDVMEENTDCDVMDCTEATDTTVSYCLCPCCSSPHIKVPIP